MAITSDEILNALESSYMLAPPIPGVLEYLDIDGIQGRYSPKHSHPISNLIVKTMLTEENADETIQYVREKFSDWNKAFGWRVSAANTPADLDQRLLAAGLTKAIEMAGMSLDVNHPITANPDIQVREVMKNDLALASDLYHRAFPLPKQLCDHIMIIMEAMKSVNYFAYVEESDAPAAIASMVYMPDQPIALLGGAATLPEYRGRGIYTALVAQRLRIARDNGMQTAVISAMRNTSAPICQKLGFVEHCSLDLYTWMPPES